MNRFNQLRKFIAEWMIELVIVMYPESDEKEHFIQLIFKHAHFVGEKLIKEIKNGR